MAVAARSPGSSDLSSLRAGRAAKSAAEDPPVPRVPCPLCGGAIHPVAGRCKHCKQDLASHRGRGPVGASGPIGASLPRLALGTGPMIPGDPASAIGLPSPPVELEPRARRGWLHNWPLLVITLAVVGMIVALILLVWPQHDGGARRGKRLPGSDNMNTDVLPKSGKSSAIDPWAPAPSTRPNPATPVPPPAPPPPDDAPDDPSDDDGVTGGVIGGIVGGDPGDQNGIVDPDDVVTPDEIDRVDPSADPLNGQLLAPDGVDPFAALDDPIADPLYALSHDVSAVSIMAAHACARAAKCSGRRSRIPSCAKLVKPRQSSSPPPSRCKNTVMLMTCLQQVDTLPCDAKPSLDLVQRIPACLHLLAC